MVRKASQADTDRDRSRDLRSEMRGTRAWWLIDRRSYGSRYTVLGILELDPARGFPLHSHAHASETIVVLSGACRFHSPAGARPSGPGSVMFVPPGTPHAMSAGSSLVRALTIYTGVSIADEAGWAERQAPALASSDVRVPQFFDSEANTPDSARPACVELVRATLPNGFAQRLDRVQVRAHGLAMDTDDSERLVFVLQGQGVHKRNGGRGTSLSSGDAILLDPYVSHEFHSVAPSLELLVSSARHVPGSSPA